MPTSEQKVRPAIPEEVKRSVRKRCGFGCVICGSPLYHYDHMAEYAEVRCHEAENITLLCAQHHDMKTRGRLPTSDIVEHNKSPFNIERGITTPEKIIGFSKDISGVKVRVGTNFFEYNFEGFDRFIVFSVDGVQLFHVSKCENEIFFNLLLFNEFNEPVLEVINNEMIHRSDIFDITYVGTKLVVKGTDNKIFIELKFDTDGTISVSKASLYCNGVKLILDGDILSTNDSAVTPERGGIFLQGTTVRGFPCVLAVGRQVMFMRPVGDSVVEVTPVPAAMLHEKVLRYPDES